MRSITQCSCSRSFCIWWVCFRFQYSSERPRYKKSLGKMAKLFACNLHDMVTHILLLWAPWNFQLSWYGNCVLCLLDFFRAVVAAVVINRVRVRVRVRIASRRFRYYSIFVKCFQPANIFGWNSRRDRLSFHSIPISPTLVSLFQFISFWLFPYTPLDQHSKLLSQQQFRCTITAHASTCSLFPSLRSALAVFHSHAQIISARIIIDVHTMRINNYTYFIYAVRAAQMVEAWGGRAE